MHKPEPNTTVRVYAHEEKGHLFVMLWVPPGTIGNSGQPVDVLGFNDLHDSVSRDEVLRSVGAAIVAVAKGERLP